MMHFMRFVPSASYAMSPWLPTNLWNIYTYLTTGGGPLSDTSCGVLALINTKNEPSRPDIQLHALSAGFNIDFGAHFWSVMGWRRDSFEELFGDYMGR